MQILLDAAVKPYLPCQICFCISPLLIYASPSDHRFPELLLMQLSFTGQSYKPCAMRRETDPPYQPPLPFFSASHPCFPVRLPFPCIDSHETFFSGLFHSFPVSFRRCQQPYKPCSMLPRNRTCHINPLLLFSASHPCFPVRLPFPGTASHETLFS